MCEPNLKRQWLQSSPVYLALFKGQQCCKSKNGKVQLDHYVKKSFVASQLLSTWVRLLPAFPIVEQLGWPKIFLVCFLLPSLSVTCSTQLIYMRLVKSLVLTEDQRQSILSCLVFILRLPVHVPIPVILSTNRSIFFLYPASLPPCFFGMCWKGFYLPGCCSAIDIYA